jgi:uncharacterized protein (DUF2164 family)
MSKKDSIKLSREKKEEMIAEIKDYFLKEKEEELGNLAANLVLDFIIDKLAPEFYNQGVIDSYKYMTGRIEDMQSLLK